MKEDFISYLWKHSLFKPGTLHTLEGERVEIISPGQENPDAGPDFLAACLRIDQTTWAGNVEIHVCSSSWFAHGHHRDPSYDNIILHVVYQCDKEAQNSKGKAIPHLEIKGCFDPGLQSNYQSLMASRAWVACSKMISKVDAFLVSHWIHRMLVCRLERKSTEALRFLQYFEGHWERLFLYLLAKSLGAKANALAFGLLVQRLPYPVIARIHDQPFVLEALLLGQAGMLSGSLDDPYPRLLQKEHVYLKKKFRLPVALDKKIWKYARMRPMGFPDLRMAQLAMMIHRGEGRMFAKVLGESSLMEAGKSFAIKPTDYWDTHYRLGALGKHKTKTPGKESINHIMINAIAPAAFIYAKEKNRNGLAEAILKMLGQLPPEDNRIIRNWKNWLEPPTSAAESQGMLELFKSYCVPRKCLRCPVGYKILRNGHQKITNKRTNGHAP